jgi:hypothetical protein
MKQFLYSKFVYSKCVYSKWPPCCDAVWQRARLAASQPARLAFSMPQAPYVTLLMQDLISKFNNRAHVNLPKGFQGLRKRFLVPVAPPFELLRFGLTLQLTTDLDLHKRAVAALADGAIGLPADDPGLVLHQQLQGIIGPRELQPGEPGGPPEALPEKVEEDPVKVEEKPGKGEKIPVKVEEKNKLQGPVVPLHKPVDPLLDVARLSAVLAAVEGRHGSKGGGLPGAHAYIQCFSN